MNREAWFRYIEAHRPQIEADFEEAARLIRTGNRQGLVEFLLQKGKGRTRLAAEDALGLLHNSNHSQDAKDVLDSHHEQQS